MKIIIPEKLSKNHNVSPESDLHHVARYLGFFLFLLLGLYIFFYVISFVVISYVSIEDEKKYFGSKDFIFEETEIPEDLAERYKDIGYDVYLIDSDDGANAFAGLGGNIYITEDLLHEIENYETLDFIVGHEIAHIENRDVLKRLISHFPIQLIVSIFGQDSGAILFNNMISHSHSRGQESRADIYGIEFVQDLNGHVGCSLDFFESKNSFFDNILEIFSTHPMTELRLEKLHRYIDKKGYTRGECTAYSY